MLALRSGIRCGVVEGVAVASWRKSRSILCTYDNYVVEVAIMTFDPDQIQLRMSLSNVREQLIVFCAV